MAKKFINDPRHILAETLEGQVAAYHGSIKLIWLGVPKTAVEAGAFHLSLLPFYCS